MSETPCREDEAYAAGRLARYEEALDEMEKSGSTDGPNVHRYRDADFVTSETLFTLTDPDGNEHAFYVPTRIVEQIVTLEQARHLTEDRREDKRA